MGELLLSGVLGADNLVAKNGGATFGLELKAIATLYYCRAQNSISTLNKFCVLSPLAVSYRFVEIRELASRFHFYGLSPLP